MTNLCVCAERGRGTRQHTMCIGDFVIGKSIGPAGAFFDTTEI